MTKEGSKVCESNGDGSGRSRGFKRHESRIALAARTMPFQHVTGPTLNGKMKPLQRDWSGRQLQHQHQRRGLQFSIQHVRK